MSANTSTILAVSFISAPRDQDLERAGLTRPCEDVVRVHELVEGEMVGHEALCVDLTGTGELEQRRRREGIDQAGGDGHVADPQVLEVERGRLAVDADVGDPAPRADQGGG